MHHADLCLIMSTPLLCPGSKRLWSNEQVVSSPVLNRDNNAELLLYRNVPRLSHVRERERMRSCPASLAGTTSQDIRASGGLDDQREMDCTILNGSTYLCHSTITMTQKQLLHVECGNRIAKNCSCNDYGLSIRWQARGLLIKVESGPRPL